MHFNFCNIVFLTTICLIFSIVYAGPKNDYHELLMNTTKIFSNRNRRTAYQLETRELGASDSGILDFFSREPSLSALDISFNNNEKNIDILKKVLNSGENQQNKTKSDNKKEYGVKSHFAGLNLTTNISSDKSEAKENNLTTPKPSLKENSLTISNNSPLNYENATFSSLPAKEQQYENNKDTATAIGQDNAEDSIVSNKTDTKTEDQTTTREIILSEIRNLSLDNSKAIALGQKINFQQSTMDFEEGKINAAGKEILQNTSEICGYLFGKRISFAEPTTLMEFPWTALLLYNTNIRYHCGGSLITTKYVLTAAHCVAQQFYELTGVRLGEYDISEPIDCAPDVAGSKICSTTVDVNVVKIIVHHGYSHSSFKNDIALLRLDKDYLGRSFYPICLPTPEMMFGGRMATVAGWGATEKDLRSSILLKATVPIFDISKCNEIYRYHVFNDSTEICASGANEVDVCKGDSGGAIFYSHYVGGKEKYFQLGIISLGVRGCGDKRFLPAVFTKITGFYKWIENNLEY